MSGNTFPILPPHYLLKEFEESEMLYNRNVGSPYGETLWVPPVTGKDAEFLLRNLHSGTGTSTSFSSSHVYYILVYSKLHSC